MLLNNIQKQLLNYLQEHGPTETTQLVKALNKPKTTIWDNLRRMKVGRLVVSYPIRKHPVGSPSTAWELVENMQYCPTCGKRLAD